MANPLTETAFELPIGSKKVAVPRWLLLGAVGGLIVILLLAKKGTAQTTADEGEAEEGGGIGEWLDQLEEELNQEQGPVETPAPVEAPSYDQPSRPDKTVTPTAATDTYVAKTEPFYSPSPQSSFSYPLATSLYNPTVGSDPDRATWTPGTPGPGATKSATKTYTKSAPTTHEQTIKSGPLAGGT